MTTASRRAIALTLLLCCAVITATGGPAAGMEPTPDFNQRTDVTATSGPALAVQDGANDTAEPANETPRHRNPDEYGEDGNLEDVESWLEGALSSRLGDSAIQLSEGEYDRAKEYVGEEYHDRLDQYVDVAGDTDGGGEDDNEEQATAFTQARDDQEHLADMTETYRETRAVYDQAREIGNDERARELARVLETIATDIDQTSGRVQQQYETIEGGTGANLTAANTAIQDVNQEIQAEQAEIRDAEFRETDLTLDVDNETISFREPLNTTGQLRTANGTPIANETIRLDIGTRSHQVETNASGVFTLQYRPLSLPVNTTTLQVEYIPTDQSVYLGTTTSIAVSVEQVTPSTTVTVTPNTVAYGDNTTLTGDIGVDGAPVHDVPLVVTLDGHRLGTMRAQHGAFAGTVTIPAPVAAGEHNLTVRLPFTDQALAETTATESVTVNQTATNLSIDVRTGGEAELAVNGTLTTAAGGGVASQPVDIQVDGTTVGTVTTAADGAVAATVPVPERANGEIRVLAVYEGRGSSLERVEAATSIHLGGGNSGGSDSGAASLPSWAWLAIGLALVLVIGAGIWWRQRGRHGDSTSVSTDDGQSSTTTDESAAGPSVTQAVLARASEDLAAGRPDAAVQSGYAAVRQALGDRLDDTALTHWEFYQRYQDTQDAPGSSSLENHNDNPLRTVTAGYERAAFDPNGVSTEEATTILERVRELCGVDSDQSHGAPADD